MSCGLGAIVRLPLLGAAVLRSRVAAAAHGVLAGGSNATSWAREFGRS